MIVDRYALHDLPAGTVHSIVWIWPGYEVPGAATTDKRGNRLLYEVRGRELVPLQVEPHAWAPADARAWRWPDGRAPAPLPIEVLPRMAQIGGVEFCAATAAAEMEADRETARARRDDDAPDEVSGQWWRDASRIRYQPMGSVTQEHGEARIMRALIVERSIRLDMAPYKTSSAVMADLKASLADVLAEEPDADWVPQIKPLPTDWADYEHVMGWLSEVMPNRREMRILRARMISPPETWSSIGWAMRRRGYQIKAQYDKTISQLVEAANRSPRRRLARIRELRARNREARLRG